MRQLCHDAAIGAEGCSERTDRKNGLRRSGGRKEAAEFGGFVQGERVEESRFERYIACGGMVGDGGFTPQGGVNFDPTISTTKKQLHLTVKLFFWWGMVDLPLKGYKLRLHDPHSKKTAPPNGETVFLVGDGGFEPPKASPADLQSVPFGHSGNPPYI